MILPGATLGILGGGQLGRLFVAAARTMGYAVVVLDPEADCPAAQLADKHIHASYTDHAALERLAQECAAITTEFENVPASALDYLASARPVRPSGAVLAISQDRILEKNFLQSKGFDIAPFVAVEQRLALSAALQQVASPALMKSARAGYDGKGQRWVRTLSEAEKAFDDLGGKPCVLEARVNIQIEISVVLARGEDGRVVTYPLSENKHHEGILDVSIVPARISTEMGERATQIAIRIAEVLNYHGVMAVEFFITQDGQLFVNEIAPRPHNSGHYTVDACITSQFEQQVRALCGLPLGDATLLAPAVMVNLLGDLWRGDQAPPWDQVLSHPRAKLHLYGKREARPGRKMGHFTFLGNSVEEALSQALAIQAALTHGKSSPKQP
jgi:5-(carboxyamino)imidazole ribonucleotide synthase